LEDLQSPATPLRRNLRLKNNYTLLGKTIQI